MDHLTLTPGSHYIFWSDLYISSCIRAKLRFVFGGQAVKGRYLYLLRFIRLFHGRVSYGKSPLWLAVFHQWQNYICILYILHTFLKEANMKSNDLRRHQLLSACWKGRSWDPLLWNSNMQTYCTRKHNHNNNKNNNNNNNNSSSNNNNNNNTNNESKRYIEHLLSLFLSNLKVPPIRVWNRIVPKVK